MKRLFTSLMLVFTASLFAFATTGQSFAIEIEQPDYVSFSERNTNPDPYYTWEWVQTGEYDILQIQSSPDGMSGILSFEFDAGHYIGFSYDNDPITTDGINPYGVSSEHTTYLDIWLFDFASGNASFGVTHKNGVGDASLNTSDYDDVTTTANGIKFYFKALDTRYQNIFEENTYQDIRITTYTNSMYSTLHIYDYELGRESYEYDEQYYSKVKTADLALLTATDNISTSGKLQIVSTYVLHVNGTQAPIEEVWEVKSSRIGFYHDKPEVLAELDLELKQTESGVLQTYNMVLTINKNGTASFSVYDMPHQQHLIVSFVIRINETTAHAWDSITDHGKFRFTNSDMIYDLNSDNKYFIRTSEDNNLFSTALTVDDELITAVSGYDTFEVKSNGQLLIQETDVAAVQFKRYDTTDYSWNFYIWYYDNEDLKFKVYQGVSFEDAEIYFTSDASTPIITPGPSTPSDDVDNSFQGIIILVIVATAFIGLDFIFKKRKKR